MNETTSNLSGLRLDLAAFRELEAFAQLGTDLDPATQARLDRGYRMVELLKQPQYQPYPVEEQIVSIYAVTKGYLDDLPVGQVAEFERLMLDHFQGKAPELLETIRETGQLTDEVEEKIGRIIEEFKAAFQHKDAS